jgi:hypothetical protein
MSASSSNGRVSGLNGTLEQGDERSGLFEELSHLAELIVTKASQLVTGMGPEFL